MGTVQVDAYLKMSAKVSPLCLPADGDQGNPKEEATRVSFYFLNWRMLAEVEGRNALP